MKKVICISRLIPGIKNQLPDTSVEIGTTYEVEEQRTVPLGEWAIGPYGPFDCIPGLYYRLVGVTALPWHHSGLFSDLPSAEEGYISVSEEIGRTAIARFNTLQTASNDR